ncbi:MAG: hypothetical protein ABI353_22520 [Isosphaeraceae bacterium]
MSLTLRSAVANFGKSAKAKLTNPGARGEPEDQLRAPLEHLLADMAELCGIPRSEVAAVGESSLTELKTRPDYAMTVRNALVGFVEVKAPGKGADPRRFRDRHDKDQWKKLQSLPNLIYTDGNEFCLCRSGEVVGSLVRVNGDIQTSGATLDAPPTLQVLFENFIRWQPIPPRDAKQLAETSARLCRLLREEVTEQMASGSPALTALAADWRKVLFPDATDASSPTATLRRSLSACSWPGRETSSSARGSIRWPSSLARPIPSSAAPCACSRTTPVTRKP